MAQHDDVTIEQTDRTNPHEQETVPPSGSAAAIAGILDGYMAELQAGKAPDRDQLLAAHPELATQLEACLAGIEFVHRATGPAAEQPATLGEFRILRELGRGGMGVVYEAEQTSLCRRVALKVLRFGVGADEEAMQRFRREAETVAGLHHTNIVPIFAIGSERGVHYYAMQLIAGRSLADVVEESQRTGTPLATEDIARWGLQAAEALTHAHQRGVIHRDIKPSNLLIDREGVVWLTDFGLAKRADEVTMTASGALMGTPRYMSPEQAESLLRTIDHRTDLYSLGASLYELATGRPVFESSTPHGVIIQILTEEPARPRQIRPDLPRDLETIILTCLAKDPAQRYQTAQALVDDLRTFLEGRPIKARRARILERAARFVRKRKKALSAGALVVASTVLLVVGAFLGWRYYSDWRLGRIVLSTDGPPLRAEVLPESGDSSVTEPFDVGTRTVLPLPAGDYRLRVTGTGFLGQTYRFAVNRGETRTQRLALDEDGLMKTEPISYSSVAGALTLRGGKLDFLEWTGQTLIRRDGSARPIWDAAAGRMIWDGLRLSKQPWEPKRDPVAWLRRLSFFGDRKRPGKLVQSAPDLNGDGTGDIVWVIDGTPSFLALSGADGSLLWTYSARPEGPGGPDPGGPAEPRREDPIPLLSRIRGEPAVADVDGDGTADLMATFAFFDDPAGTWQRAGGWAVTGGRGVVGGLMGYEQPANRPVVVAVSGRTGRWLWNYPLARRSESWDQLDVSLTLVARRKGSLVMVVDGPRAIPLDPATGKPQGQPIDLGFRPLGSAPDRPDRPVQYADLDGDGEPEIIASLRSGQLVAISSSTGQRLWNDPFRGGVGSPSPSILGFDGENLSIRSEWPLVADLDGDGRAEVVVPGHGRPPPGDTMPVGVRMLDGATGQARWTRLLNPRGTGGLVHLVAGPDLDGDGTRDLVAVSHHLTPVNVYVDALSGKDGHPLWWWHAEFQDGSSLLVWPPRWWGRGPDGWPLLVVPLGGNLATASLISLPTPPEPPVVHLLSASTGREVHALDGLSWPRVADLDGDGLEDLWGSVEGKLRVFRGEPTEAWRALGRFQPAGDLDGDGLADVVSADLNPPESAGKARLESRVAVARSGRDGRVLWKISLETWAEEQGYNLANFPTIGDLDGDGAPDVVVSQRFWVRRKDGPPATLPLQVLSGRSGRRLWSAGPLPLGFEAYGFSRVEGIDVHPDKVRGRSDLLVFHDCPFDGRTRLARLSGRDGRVVWDVPLLEWHDLNVTGPARKLPHEFGDLDGDGDLDIVVAIEATSPGAGTVLELHALSLADGKVLWAQPIRFKAPVQECTFAVSDLDGDGRAEVIVKDTLPADSSTAIEVTAHDGRDGATRWTWRGGSRWDRSQVLRTLPVVDLEGTNRRGVCLRATSERSLTSGPVDQQRFTQLLGELKAGEWISGYGMEGPLWRTSQRLLILDEQGHERSSPQWPPFHEMASADLDGDGRVELVLRHHDNELHATRGNLQELWMRPTHLPVQQIIPARAGGSATVVLQSMLGLDGATGRPRWSGGASSVILDAGGAADMPHLLGGPAGTTVCRLALPTTAAGAISPPRGEPARPSTARDDPRWERPLPWSTAISSNAQPRTYGTAAWLALINVVLPLAILRLAARRRVSSLRLLLALPVAVAVPVAMFLHQFGSWTPPLDDPSTWSAIRPFALTALAGLPILFYLVSAAGILVRRRWRRSAVLIGLTVVASVVLGALWLRWDAQMMFASELAHYNGSDWYLVVLPGAYAVGVLLLVGWVLRGMFRRLRRARSLAKPALA